MGHLKFQLKPFLKNYPALISRLPSTSPLFWTLKEFFTDDHPTDLARAARFLSASSAPEKPAVTEEALAKIALDIAKKELKEE